MTLFFQSVTAEYSGGAVLSYEISTSELWTPEHVFHIKKIKRIIKICTGLHLNHIYAFAQQTVQK